MYILGISAYYHDSAACLVRDGEIIAAAQEERFTRIKHDHAFPQNAIQFCLEFEGIQGKDLDYVAFYDKPFLKFERILESYMTYAPLGISSFIKAIPLWIKKKLWIKDLIQNELQFEGQILFPEHHQSHAASAFLPSPFDEAAFLTIDGVGEWTTTSFGTGKSNEIELVAEQKFPHSIGLLYSAFTYYTGFRVNSGEYKVMGLAPYGEPRYKDLILDHLIDVKDDGSFMLNMDYFNYPVGLTMTNRRFHTLFGGPPRKPESPLTQKEMDLARSVQEVVEDVVLKMGHHIAQKTGQKNLCLAGGVALNCVANGKLLRESIFDDIWIQPAAGDAGGALGAALYVWHHYLKNPRTVETDAMKGAFLGPEFSNDEIAAFLNAHDIPFNRLNDNAIAQTVADLIADENVVGWFNGRMEFGPRALGARSIIGDARSPKMQEIMNLKIKFRESFRPFAPSVLDEKASDYFNIDRSSPYMLLVAGINEKRLCPLSDQDAQKQGMDKLKVIRSEIPAVTHVDNTARLQTVHKETNPRYHEMIQAFFEKQGCPVIINTSFNVRGEPIVCTPEDAFSCFMNTQMDYLILGPYLLDKNQQKKKSPVKFKRDFILD